MEDEEYAEKERRKQRGLVGSRRQRRSGGKERVAKRQEGEVDGRP